MNTEKYDILIIGGGPSGSTAAHWAAKHALKTVIVDAKSFPRDKICGDGLPAMTNELLNELGINLYELPDRQVAKVNTLKINAPAVSYHLDTTYTPFFNVARKDFDNFVWSAIPNSVLKYESYKPTSLSYDFFKQCYRVEIEGKDSIVVIYAAFIIGADGANSWVRKKTGLFTDFNMDFTIAKRAYAQVEQPKAAIELDYISTKNLSYKWQFSLPRGKVNLGVYHSSTGMNAERENGKKCIASIGNTTNAMIDWSTYDAFPIPTFHPSVTIFSKKGVFLIGDAAGFSDPIFGHGIDIGMLSGKIAVKSIQRAKNLLVFDRKRKAAEIYNSYINKNIATKFNKMRNYMSDKEIYNLNDLVEFMRDNMVVNKELI